MSSPLFNQLNKPVPVNPMMQKLVQFKNSFNGNPQEIIQQMLNNGKLSQDQLNQYAQQANNLYNQMKNMV